MEMLLITALAAQAAAAAGPPMPPAADPNETIIVTGTRLSGIRAKDSVEPVQVVSSKSLEQSGSRG
jgi:iron complex outermembrane receptor protein